MSGPKLRMTDQVERRQLPRGQHDDGRPNDASMRRTICEVIREINDLHQGIGVHPAETSSSKLHDEQVRALCREAQDMGKRMARKLLEYNKAVFRDWWAANPDFEADLRRRMDKDYLI